MWLRFTRVNHIGEFHSILDEEHRDVVPNHIPIAFFRVEFDGKTSHISYSISTGEKLALFPGILKIMETNLPRLPKTVENRTNTGVVREVSVRTPADVTSAALS